MLCVIVKCTDKMISEIVSFNIKSKQQATMLLKEHQK
jgi:hypothetical protein